MLSMESNIPNNTRLLVVDVGTQTNTSLNTQHQSSPPLVPQFQLLSIIEELGASLRKLEDHRLQTSQLESSPLVEEGGADISATAPDSPRDQAIQKEIVSDDESIETAIRKPGKFYHRATQKVKDARHLNLKRLYLSSFGIKHDHWPLGVRDEVPPRLSTSSWDYCQYSYLISMQLLTAAFGVVGIGKLH